MKRLIVLWMLFLGWMELPAQYLNVGIYREHPLTAAVVHCSSGNFQLVSEGRIITRLETGGTLYLTLEEGRIKVLDDDHDFGYFEQIEMRALTLEAYFRIHPQMPELESMTCDDNLIARAAEQSITLINQVDMDKYLAGVVEALAGESAEKEFYKALSVLCRTYALKNLDRHSGEGFQLCDGSHCQLYRGKGIHGSDLLEAIQETTGVVVADYNFKLITAAYHLNSGGQTARASDVWSAGADYLQSVVDPYSLHQEHAKWVDSLSFSDWKQYLLDNGMRSVNRIPVEILYVEQMRRKRNFVLDKDSIRMTKISADWGFHSSFFDMFPEGDSVLVWGKGYGHGVGLSLEGAMKMARDGFSYQDILKFYFYEVRLMDYRDLPESSLQKSKLIY
jgi:stage II sporulation protein D